jgi:protein TorT
MTEGFRLKHVLILILLSVILPVPASEPKDQPWRLCAVYPHLKDSYWLSINFGMIKQAKQRAIELNVLEAGGYGNSANQWSQVERCRTWRADAILVGSVFYDSFSEQLELINQSTPLFGLVNEVSTVKLTASTGVSWQQMGYKLGHYLALRHPAGSDKVSLAWLPGPKYGGGSRQATAGLRAAISGSAVELVTVKYGLNEKIAQFSLIRSVLEQYPGIDYLAGNAVMAEMAISEVADMAAVQRPQILSHYLSHGVYRGIRRGKILMANSDQMVRQGMMAIDQAIDYLEGHEIKRQQGPTILTIDQAKLGDFDINQSLSPSYFKPQYRVLSEVGGK